MIRSATNYPQSAPFSLASPCIEPWVSLSITWTAILDFSRPWQLRHRDFSSLGRVQSLLHAMVGDCRICYEYVRSTQSGRNITGKNGQSKPRRPFSYLTYRRPQTVPQSSTRSKQTVNDE